MTGTKRPILVVALAAVIVAGFEFYVQPPAVRAGPQDESSKRAASAYNPYPPGILPADPMSRGSCRFRRWGSVRCG